MIELAFPIALLLLPAPALVWWFAPPYRQNVPALRSPFFRDVVARTGGKARSGSITATRSPAQMSVAILVWCLVLLSLAQPVRVGDPITVTKAARDLVLAIDISGSMDDRDFTDPSGAPEQRFDAVKRIVGEFVKRRDGDRIALIVFGTRAYVQVPFTEDLATVQAMLQETEVGMAGPHTSLGDAMGLAIRLFETSDLDERVLIVLSDGADTGSRMSPANAAAIAAERGVEIHTIGVGRPDGSGENRLDLKALEEIAEAANGQFYFAEDTDSLSEVYARIDAIAPRTAEIISHRPREALGHWPLAMAGVLVLLTLALLQVLSRHRLQQ
ncbi:MAG: VWA domain-containing protein [Pseudomonadota bacterium]